MVTTHWKVKVQSLCYWEELLGSGLLITVLVCQFTDPSPKMPNLLNKIWMKWKVYAFPGIYKYMFKTSSFVLSVFCWQLPLTWLYTVWGYIREELKNLTRLSKYLFRTANTPQPKGILGHLPLKSINQTESRAVLRRPILISSPCQLLLLLSQFSLPSLWGSLKVIVEGGSLFFWFILVFRCKILSFPFEGGGTWLFKKKHWQGQKLSWPRL